MGQFAVGRTRRAFPLLLFSLVVAVGACSWRCSPFGSVLAWLVQPRWLTRLLAAVLAFLVTAAHVAWAMVNLEEWSGSSEPSAASR